MKHFLTSGLIAETIQRSPVEVRRCLERAGIEPIGRAGAVRIYDADAVGLVRAELVRLDAARSERERREAADNPARDGHDER